MQIKSPLANKILGPANKISFAGADFTLPVGSRFYSSAGVGPFAISPSIQNETKFQSSKRITVRHIKGSDNTKLVPIGQIGI